LRRRDPRGRRRLAARLPILPGLAFSAHRSGRDHAGERCVLGRSHRFQSGMWSCLAGFVEPGETVEEAVRRETREEAGIICGRVGYFASQPWPFPTSLMVGCTAQARSREIVVDHTELDDARWFDRDEVAAMLLGRHPAGLTAPLPHAIAHHLLRAWVEQEIELG